MIREVVISNVTDPRYGSMKSSWLGAAVRL
jgi:hypothetical protein